MQRVAGVDGGQNSFFCDADVDGGVGGKATGG